MHQALYRKWRPQSFADVVGQSAITDTLTKQVETGKTSHAYLFSGSRGTGKTTCAKILAKAINCENPFHGNPCNECSSCKGIMSGEILDVVEIDAASNNGVDYVRDLREEAIYSPANAKKRVYIVDEVHMFSSQAFNALLKIMEEPPSHVVFILATTELHKVPATISSRCQRFIFKRIPQSVIADRLQFITRSEGATLSDDAAGYIANLSDGAMRDALSLLDQCISVGEGNVDAETVENVVGLAGKKQTFDMANAIADRDVGASLTFLNDIYTSGKNLSSVLTELAEVFRDVLILKTAGGEKLPRLSARYTDGELRSLSDKFDTLRLCRAVEALQEATGAIASSSNKRIDAELCCVRLCEGADSADIDSVISRVNELENKIKNGSFAAVPARDTAPRPEVSEAAKVSPQQKREEPAPVRAEDKKPEVALSENEKTPTVQKSATSPASGDAKALWSSILSAAKGKLSPGVAPLFGGVAASLSESTLSLSSDNPFVLQMLTRAENLDILRSAASSVAPGITVTAGKKVEVPKVETSGLDELLAGLDDDMDITIQ
ncbi:MAG: DNA polymerase III subunit gamma/tau [Oscillospiraceae bacterium]|nr:DNA polymerase III subunit gamma/tau [Oscillospiraceae bacterium]